MKSEGADGTELVGHSVEAVKELLLPEKGAMFEIVYFDGENESMIYGKEPHAWAQAVSHGLKIVAWGPKCRLSQLRQQKPLVPAFLKGPDGAYRRALQICLGGDAVGKDGDYYIYILGNLIVIQEEKMRVAQLVNDESLTPSDRALLERVRKAQEEQDAQ